MSVVLQLSLDLSGQSDRVLDLSLSRWVELTSRIRPEGVTLELTAESGRSARVSIRVLPPVAIDVQGHLRPWWSVCTAATWRLRTRTHDVLDSVAEWVWRESRGAAGPPRRRDPYGRWREVARALDDVLDQVRRALLQRCVPQALAAAALFRPACRFEAYRWFAADATGRLAQLAISSPGLVLWALRARADGDPDTVATIERRVIAGDRPRDVLRALLRARPGAQRTDGEREVVRKLVERASTWVSPGDLSAMSHTLAVDDVPRGRVAAASWFRVVARVLGGAGDIADKVAPFVSKHAGRLARWSDADLVNVGIGLAVLSAASGGGLTRRNAFDRTLDATLRLVCDLPVSDRVTLGTSLPAAPLPDLEHGDATWRRLDTVGALVREGLLMKHCVASLARDALAGRVAVYHLTVALEQVTVALERNGGVLEVAGPRNTDPSTRAMNEVARAVTKRAPQLSGKMV